MNGAIDQQARGLEALPLRRRLWGLGLLFVLGIFNYLDRTLIAILQIPMKAELGLSDTELGLVIGASFGLVYTLAALPLGFLADRTGRRLILGLALLVWTLLTGATGLVAGLGMLLVCRMGVALGEAACAPISHSLISDYFPFAQRARATAFWSLSLPVGIVLGFLLGGWLSTAVGWRTAFILMGGIGLILVPLLLLTLPDRAAIAKRSSAKELPSAWAMARTAWRTRAYRYVLIGAALHLFTLHSLGVWLPQFFARAHGLPTPQVAGIMALLSGAGGGLGMIASGIAGDRLGRRDPRWYIYLSLAAVAILVPMTLLQLWATSLTWAIVAGFVGGIMGQVFFAPAIAVTQSLMPAPIRSFTGAFYVCFANVFSMSLGPVMVGGISDGIGGAGGLRIAMSVSLAGSLVSLPFFFLAARHLRPDLARIDERATGLGL